MAKTHSLETGHKKQAREWVYNLDRSIHLYFFMDEIVIQWEAGRSIHEMRALLLTRTLPTSLQNIRLKFTRLETSIAEVRKAA